MGKICVLFFVLMRMSMVIEGASASFGLSQEDTFDSNLPEINIEEKRAIEDLCSLPIKAGNCPIDGARYTRWFFNHYSNKCETFKGCAGYGNNFPSKSTCEFRCLPRKY